MYRCALIVFAASLVASAHAQQQRPFPPDALRGELLVTQFPEARLNDQDTRLAPGARIRAADNMLALPGSVSGQKFQVHYTVDMLGQLKDIWILNAAELAHPRWPSSREEAQRWVFDPNTQSWSKP